MEKLSRYKTKLVANGKSQQLDIDCDETFSLVVKPSTICVVLHTFLPCSWHLHQLDVKNAFLHGDLQKIVYMHQPLDFVDKSKPDHVYLLWRSLYGFKQALGTWYTRFGTVAKCVGFLQRRSDPSLYIVIYPWSWLHHGVSLLLHWRHHSYCLHTNFASTDHFTAWQSIWTHRHGTTSPFFGIAVMHNDACFFLSQLNYVVDILHRASKTACNPCHTPVETKAKDLLMKVHHLLTRRCTVAWLEH